MGRASSWLTSGSRASLDELFSLQEEPGHCAPVKVSSAGWMSESLIIAKSMCVETSRLLTMPESKTITGIGRIQTQVYLCNDIFLPPTVLSVSRPAWLPQNDFVWGIRELRLESWLGPNYGDFKMLCWNFADFHLLLWYPKFNLELYSNSLDHKNPIQCLLHRFPGSFLKILSDRTSQDPKIWIFNVSFQVIFGE